MLLIMCFAGSERFAIRSQHVTEVVPLARLQHPKGLSNGLAGLMVYRGATMFVADLTQIACGLPCPSRLSSRIVVLKTPFDTADRRFGLMAERVGLYEAPEVAGGNAFHQGEASAVGNLCRDAQGIFQLVDPGVLVGKSLTEPFCCAAEESR
jgi:chemotaxis signal transduction protein